MYTLASVEPDGTIRVVDTDRGAGWSSVVHRETVGVHTWGGSCYASLQGAKERWSEKSTLVILALSDEGACTAVWMADSQRDTLVPRINKWKGCYGTWPIRKLNA